MTTPTHSIGTGHEGSIREQVVAYVQGVRHGDMGSLPAIAGLVTLSVLFTFLNPHFLTKLNFANLFTQATTLMMLAMALVFVILIAEIDLSAGVTSGVTMSLFVVLVNKHHVNWIIGLTAALLFGVAIGSFIGYFVAVVGVPSFVVTLGLFLGFQGLQLVLLGDGGLYRIETPEIRAIMNSNMPTWAGWLMLVIVLIVSFATSTWDRSRRSAAGVVNRPIALVYSRLAVIAVVGGIVVFILNKGRSVSIKPIHGVPIVIPIALAILWTGTFVLDRTQFGRHLYAVGGNPEAARRAGIKVAKVRILAFITCSVLSVVSGVFASSRVGVVDTSAGRSLVLSGVAAAVVGGVSLFGGRGRLAHAAIGAFVIAIIDNGLGLLGLAAGVNFMVTGGVLILAATIDALSRKRGGGSIARI
jgi:D-xylose transport system permease protein